MTLRTCVKLSSLVPAACVAGLLAASPVPASAQTMQLSIIRPERSVAEVPARPGRTVDGYYAHYRLDTPGDRIGVSGVGARFMWSPARADYGVTALPSRFAVGLFGEYVPNQEGRSFSLGHAGVTGDVNVLRTPLFGRIQPVASLGAGVLWTNREGPAIRGPEFVIGNETAAMFSLAPSLGTRVSLWRDFGLRADARDLITFRDATRHHVQLAAGLSFPF